MARGDRTGPKDRGPGTGKGQGRGSGRAQGGGGRGRRGGLGTGPGGFCVCPNCGERAPHQPGSPCYEQKCPKCKTAMTRE